MNAIGVAHYRRIGGDLRAIWYNSALGEPRAGTGTATGESSGGFPGVYRITYRDSEGRLAGAYDLKIERKGRVFDLSWSRNGRALFVGVGIETPDGLAVAWRAEMEAPPFLSARADAQRASAHAETTRADQSPVTGEGA